MVKQFAFVIAVVRLTTWRYLMVLTWGPLVWDDSVGTSLHPSPPLRDSSPFSSPLTAQLKWVDSNFTTILLKKWSVSITLVRDKSFFSDKLNLFMHYVLIMPGSTYFVDDEDVNFVNHCVWVVDWERFVRLDGNLGLERSSGLMFLSFSEEALS